MTFIQATKKIWEKIKIMTCTDDLYSGLKARIIYPDNAVQELYYSQSAMCSNKDFGKIIKNDIMSDPRFVYLVAQELKRTQSGSIRCAYCDSPKPFLKEQCQKCGGTENKIDTVTFSVSEGKNE